MITPEQYCCPPLVRFPMGDVDLIYYPLTGMHCHLPRQAVSALTGCDRFRSLDEHVQWLCHLFGAEEAAIAGVLDGAVQDGLLLSRSELLRRAADNAKRAVAGRGSADGRDAGIAVLAIVTRDRLGPLTRCLTSYAAACARHGRTVRVLIADDSRDSGYWESCRQLMSAVRRRYGFEIGYVGRAERFRWRTLLSQLHCSSDDTLDFALFGDEQCGITTGANRNGVLLATAGDLVLSADDDTECRIADIPASEEGILTLGHHEAPWETWFFQDRAEALAAAEFGDADLLGWHERLLGRPLSDVGSGPDREKLRLEHACGHLVTSLYRGRGAIALTFNGLLGDVAAYASGWSLTDPSEPTRLRVVESESSYAVAGCTREVLRGVPNPVVCHGGPFMAYTVGMDNRRLLPPFCPVMRNQDGVLGATILACDPEAYFGHLPIAVLHVPMERRKYAAGRGEAILRTRFSDLLPLLVLDAPRRVGGVESNLRSLGNHLVDLGCVDARDFEEVARLALLRRLSGYYGSVRHSIEQHSNPPEYWRSDVEQVGAMIQSSIDCGEYLTLADIEPLSGRQTSLGCAQGLVRRFGALLRDWPDIVAASRELRARGEEPATPVA